MTLLDMMKHRRSVRKYTDKKIEKEKMDMILQAGLLSASGRNIHPVEYIVVEDREMLQKLAKSRNTTAAAMLENAAAAIVVIADSDKSDMWTEDACIAMTNMHLMADSLGIGSCWIQGRGRVCTEEMSADDYIRKLLGYPENYKLEATLSLGYTENHPAEHELEKLGYDRIHYGKF